MLLALIAQAVDFPCLMLLMCRLLWLLGQHVHERGVVCSLAPQAQLCMQLQKVELVGAKGVDDAALSVLVAACPCLRQLSLKVLVTEWHSLLLTLHPAFCACHAGCISPCASLMLIARCHTRP